MRYLSARALGFEVFMQRERGWKLSVERCRCEVIIDLPYLSVTFTNHRKFAKT